MHAEGIVARILGPCITGIHAKRAEALRRATAALLRGGVTSLSAIALHLCHDIAFKHRLKSVDRLLGNPALHRSRGHLYRCLAQRWLKDVAQWLVVVDWSDVTLDQRWQLLRASVVVAGRSITLYEEVHPQRKLGNPKVHRAFLRRLGGIVPPGCRLIVMTDAGFHAAWFKLVKEQGLRVHWKDSRAQPGTVGPRRVLDSRARPVWPRPRRGSRSGIGRLRSQQSGGGARGACQTSQERTASSQHPRRQTPGARERQVRQIRARARAFGIEPRTATFERCRHYRALCTTHAHRTIVPRYQERASRFGPRGRALAQCAAFRNVAAAWNTFGVRS